VYFAQPNFIVKPHSTTRNIQVALAYAERGGGFCGCQHGGSSLYSHSNTMIAGGVMYA
jgi:hypothetical protein